MATLNLGNFENLKSKSVIGYTKDKKLEGYAKEADATEADATVVASFTGSADKNWTLTLAADGVKEAEIKGIKETSGEKNWTMNLSKFDITEGVELGDGNDKVTVGSASEKSILLGGGNNEFTSTGKVEGITISAEGGSDKFTLAGLKDVKVETGAGKDTVVLGNNTSATIDLGDGADSLSFDTEGAALSSDVVVTLGEGKDTVDTTWLASGTLTLEDYNITEDTFNTGKSTFDVENFKKDGTVKVGTGGLVSLKAEGGYYAIKGEKEGYVAWATDGGTSIDLSSFNKEVKIIGSNNEDAVDTLIGGTKADTIYAGAGDVVYGGAGADTIKITTSTDAGVLVGLAAAGGKDSVAGFRAGSEDSNDTVYLFENGIGDGVKLSLTNKTDGNLVLAQGSANLTLSDVSVGNNSDKTIKIQDNTGNTYAVDFVNGKVAVDSVDSIASVYYGNTARKDNALDFSKVSDSLVVDLGNTGYFQNTGSAVYAGNFASVTGGKENTILMGKADVSETLTAGTGNTTLWGGGAKADLLDGGSGNSATDNVVTYFYTAGDGKDTVTNFVAGTADDNADVLYLSNVSASSITRDSKAITISTAESTDKLTVVLGSGSADSVIQYTTDGQTVNQVKIGVSNKANNFTYSDGVQAYMGGKNNTLKVTADADNANIWLDGSQGVTYENVTKVDASASSNTVVIAGNGATNETLIGGAGENSLWGGAGSSDDTLKGSNGVGTTTYYFGSGDGDDVITNTGSDDKVVLYNVATSDLVAIDNSTSTMKFTLADRSTLSIKGMSTTSVKTFQLGDGSNWEYDYASKSWTQK